MFSNTTLAQFQIEQDLKSITEGLKLRGMASVRTYTENENQRSLTPFFYGLSEIETDLGTEYALYQIQEGTEYLNDPTVSNYGNSNFYYELVAEYNREFNEKLDRLLKQYISNENIIVDIKTKIEEFPILRNIVNQLEKENEENLLSLNQQNIIKYIF